MSYKRTSKQVRMKNLPSKPILGNFSNSRSTTLSEFAIKQIVENIESGLSLAKSYRTLGISDKNFQAWMKKGEEDFRNIETLRSMGVTSSDISMEYFLFGEITRATNAIEKELVSTLREAAAKGAWQSAKFLLGKLNKDDWGDEVKDVATTNNTTNNLIIVPATSDTAEAWDAEVLNYNKTKEERESGKFIDAEHKEVE